MDLATKQYLIALGVFAVGLAGVLAPMKWNPLQLRRPYNKWVGDRGNKIFARAFGSILVFVSVVMVVLTIGGSDFMTRQ